MTECINNDRFTSKDLRIEFMPCGNTEQNHIQHLYFHEDVAGGTFTLRVNGEQTDAITFSATAATLITNINSALAALDVLGATEIVASGSAVTDITLTSDATDGKKYYVILVDGSALTGNTSDQENVTTQVTQQGTTLYTLSTQISAFGYEESIDTVDVTAISEYEKTELPVSSSMTWNATIFEANEAWKHAVYAGQTGIMHVYPKGKFVGNPYFVFRALIDKAGVEFPDHEVVEASLDGQRQGAMIVPFNSVYKG